MLWKTRKARPARKSRDDKRPATGRSIKPVQSASLSHLNSSYSLTSQKFGHILKLRNCVGSIVAVLLEQRKNVVVFAACMCWIEFGELAVK